MSKLQSAPDVAIEMLRDLEEFERSGSKDAFRKQLRGSSCAARGLLISTKPWRRL